MTAPVKLKHTSQLTVRHFGVGGDLNLLNSQPDSLTRGSMSSYKLLLSLMDTYGTYLYTASIPCDVYYFLIIFAVALS